MDRRTIEDILGAELNPVMLGHRKPAVKHPSRHFANIYVIDRNDEVIRRHKADLNNPRKQLWLTHMLLWATLNHHSVEIIGDRDDK